MGRHTLQGIVKLLFNERKLLLEEMRSCIQRDGCDYEHES